MTADATSKPYANLAPGADTTVNFTVSNSFTNATLPTTSRQRRAGQQQNTQRQRPHHDDLQRGGTGFEDLTLGIVPKTSIPAAAAAPTLDGAEGAGEYTGEALDIGTQVGARRRHPQLLPLGVDCGSSGAPGTPDEHLRQGHPLRRRPVLLHPRQGRLPVLRGQARRVRRALAGGLGGDHHRPARERVAGPQGHREHVQARHLPVHQRPGQHERQRRQRPVLVA